MAQNDRDRLSIQWLAALICSGVLAGMLYLSGSPDRSYDIWAIAGMIVLIALLLEKQDFVTDAIEAWHGGGGGRGGGGDDGTVEDLIQHLEEMDKEGRQRADRNARERPGVNEMVRDRDRGRGKDRNRDGPDDRERRNNDGDERD